jgi:hypothetical protein
MDGGSNPGGEYFSFNKVGRSTGTTSYNYAKSFHGRMDELRIYGKALTQSEIEQIYNERSKQLRVNSTLTDSTITFDPNSGSMEF